MTKIPNEIIDICVNFIKDNDLGPVEIFSDEKRDYNSLEKERLEFLLDICEKIIKAETNLDTVESEIKEKLEINESLNKIISSEIKKYFLSQKDKIKEEKVILTDSINKKNIFSSIINKKK